MLILSMKSAAPLKSAFPQNRLGAARTTRSTHFCRQCNAIEEAPFQDSVALFRIGHPDRLAQSVVAAAQRLCSRNDACPKPGRPGGSLTLQRRKLALSDVFGGERSLPSSPALGATSASIRANVAAVRASSPTNLGDAVNHGGK
jgi:hypothetical protein